MMRYIANISSRIILCIAVSASLLEASALYTYKGVKIEIVQGDITKQKVEALVNAANAQLRAGSGVCGAIFKAAGKSNLQKACTLFRAHKGVRCPVGDACITPSYNLSKNGVKRIIHAVGPDCRVVKKQNQRKALLSASYEHSLSLAKKHKLKSIAFPFISSAKFACPKDFAAKTAAQAIAHYLDRHKTGLREIRFVLFNTQDYTIVKKAFDRVF